MVLHSLYGLVADMPENAWFIFGLDEIKDGKIKSSKLEKVAMGHLSRNRLPTAQNSAKSTSFYHCAHFCGPECKLAPIRDRVHLALQFLIYRKTRMTID